MITINTIRLQKNPQTTHRNETTSQIGQIMDTKYVTKYEQKKALRSFMDENALRSFERKIFGTV